MKDEDPLACGVTSVGASSVEIGGTGGGIVGWCGLNSS